MKPFMYELDPTLAFTFVALSAEKMMYSQID